MLANLHKLRPHLAAVLAPAALVAAVYVGIVLNYSFELVFLLALCCYQLMRPSPPKMLLSGIAICMVGIPITSYARREYQANQLAMLAAVLLVLLAINLSLDGWQHRRSQQEE
jgi:di/tricarboxylate transporter